jgi:Uma2 family endonuclease
MMRRMTAASLPHMSLDEFLRWDDGTDRRYELMDGQVLAMAPPSQPHGTMVMAIGRQIGNALKPPCRVIGEAGLLIPGRKNTFYVADVVVTCEPLQRIQHVAAPILIVEVLSPSTEMHDRGNKLNDYRLIDSVQEIVLISSRQRRAERWVRVKGDWMVRDWIGGGTIRLESVGVDLSFDDIYQNVALPDADENFGA